MAKPIGLRYTRQGVWLFRIVGHTIVFGTPSFQSSKRTVSLAGGLCKSRGLRLSEQQPFNCNLFARHQRQDEQAIAIWMRLGENNCVRGIEALAKYHEHVTHEIEAALEFAEELLRLEPIILNPVVDCSFMSLVL